MSRVVDMYEHYKVGGYIPKLIHLAELEGEGLVCYDGNHRREVMKLLGNDGYDVDCIVDIMFNTTKDDVCIPHLKLSINWSMFQKFIWTIHLI